MEKMKKRLMLLSTGLSIALGAVFLPCDVSPVDTGITAEAAAKAKLSTSKKSVEVGDTAAITLKNVPKSKKVTVSVLKKGYVTASIGTSKTTGSNTKDVTINIKGRKTGTVRLAVRCNGKKYTCTVTVKKPTVKLSDTSKSLTKGQSFTLALKNTSSTAKWSTKSSSILKLTKVSKNKYKVTGKKAGTTYVYAKVNGKTYKCKVTVKNPSPKISKTKTTIKYGKASTITLSNAVKKVSWSSSNTSVVQVASSGTNRCKAKLTPAGVGSATVTAKSNGKTYKCKVTVKASTSPKLSKSSLTLETGDSEKLTVKGYKYTLRNWASSNKKVATVTGSGQVKAVAPGTAMISVKADGVTLKCKVTVKKALATTPSTEPDPDDWFTVIAPSTEPQTPSTEPTSKPAYPSFTTINEEIFACVDPFDSSMYNVYRKGVTDSYTLAEIEGDGTFVYDSKRYALGASLGKYLNSMGNTIECHKVIDLFDGYTFKTRGGFSIETGSIMEGGTPGMLEVYTEAPFSDVSYKIESISGEIQFENYDEGVDESGKRCIYIDYRAMRAGTVKIVLYYKGIVALTETITITSDYTEYYDYMSWKETWKAQNWTSSMDAREKLRVAGQWVLDNLDYNTYNASQYLFAQEIGGTCIASAGFIVDLAHDLGLEAVYLDKNNLSTIKGDHVLAAAKIDGHWYSFEAGFNGTAGNRGYCVVGTLTTWD